MKEQNKGNGGIWNHLMKPTARGSMGDGLSAQRMAFIRSLTKRQRRPETLHIPLDELKTTVFDLETTGFNSRHGDEILSFGAIKVDGNKIKCNEVFYSLTRPSNPVPEQIAALTGISPEIADQAPPLIEALHGFMSFVDDRVLIAHGSGHDKAFLDAALWKTTKTQLSHRLLDTMMIARKLEPDKSFSGLDEWLANYNIAITRRHHALEDAKMTAYLWQQLIHLLRQVNVINLGDLYVYLSKV